MLAPIQHKRLFRSLIVVAFLVISTIFAVVTKEEARLFTPSTIRNDLKHANALFEIPEWDISIYACNGRESCSLLRVIDSARVPIDPKLIQGIIAPNEHRLVAKMHHRLDPNLREWLQARNDVSVVIPRNIQNETRLKLGDLESLSKGRGTNTEFGTSGNSLLEKGSIEIEIDFTGFPIFGPMDVPIALTEADYAGEYQSLPTKQVAGSNLFLQLGIGFRLNIAAMALILDHSMQFGILALYGVARGIRAFIPFLLQLGVPHSRLLDFAFAGSSGFCFSVLCVLVLSMCGRHLSLYRNVLFFALSIMVFAGLPLVDDKSLIRADLYSDLASSVFGIIFVSHYLAENFRKAKRIHVDSESWLSARELLHVIGARTTIVLLGLVFSLVANASDLLASFSGFSFKDVGDWKHSVLFPLLTAAALFDVGFTSKKVASVAKQMTEKALIDRELEIAQEFQRTSFPPLKMNSEHWSWRAVYRPASKLGGDWFDICELEFADGKKMLVAAVVDVTGHGIGAALCTTVVSAVWSLWCQETVLEIAPRTEEELQRFLATAPARLHTALTASRREGSGTGVFILIDAETASLTYCTAGHPAIILSDGPAFSALSISNPALGHSHCDTLPVWECQTAPIKDGESAFLYSDGLVPPESSTSQFLSKLRRGLKCQNAPGLGLQLVRQIRATKSCYRLDKEAEDDITLLMVQMHLQKVQEKTEDSNAEYIAS